MTIDDLLTRASSDLVAASRPDVGDALTDLHRRRRRRTTSRVLVAAGAVATVVVASLTLPLGREGTEPAEPEPPTQLKLEDATRARPEVLAERRVTWRAPIGPPEFDRFDGLTDDGLVLRARGRTVRSPEYAHLEDLELGLWDPSSAGTSWLPAPPWSLGPYPPLELAADRLVFVDQHRSLAWLITFDRLEGTWSRVRVDVARAATTGFITPVGLGPDDRVYFLDGTSSVNWWSVPLDTGGQLRPEPELDGKWLAMSDDSLATTDTAGNVVLERHGETVTVVDEWPGLCPPPYRSTSRPFPAFAGPNLVVTWECSGEGLLSVFDPSGRPTLSMRVEGPIGILAATPDRLLLTANDPGTSGEFGEAFVLDLSDHSLRSLGAPGAVAWGWGLHDDLVLWPRLGPTDDNHTWDVVYSVATLP
jgi:hypothetical protein